MFSLFAVTAPGLEAYTARELRALGLLPAASPEEASAKLEQGGVSFQGDIAALFRANLYLRTASRILLRLGEFHATSFSELRMRASRIEWGAYLAPRQPVSIRVTCHQSKLYHANAVAERIAGAISDRLGTAVTRCKPADEESATPSPLVIVRIASNLCSVSIDTSGALLHRRGYRQALAKAPLRETLAAGLIMAAGWDKVSPLIDPFCGSGTIAIEAALMALNIPPGWQRRFAFMDWPAFDPARWAALQTAPQSHSATEMPLILASDRDAGAIRMAEENAERAGVKAYIHFTRQAVSALAPPPGPGWIVTNPPYGVRVSSKRDLRNLYAQFGNVLRAKCPGWHLALLCNDRMLLGQMRLALDASCTWTNGGIRVYVAKSARIV